MIIILLFYIMNRFCSNSRYYFTKSIKYIANMFSYSNNPRNILIGQLYESNSLIPEHIIILEHMKKLGLNQVNLENYKNQLIISMLNSDDYNNNNYNVISLTDLIAEIKDTDKFKNVYTNFYNKCERSMILSRFLNNSDTSNSLMNFYHALTNDELLELLDLL